MRTLLLCLLTALPSLACTCTSYEKVPACALFRGTNVIFRGRVVEKIRRRQFGDEYRVQVEEAFKGLNPETAEVIVGANYGPCAMDFKPGNDYLMYTQGDATTIHTAMPTLSISMCSPSRIIRLEDPDLTYLRSAVQGNLPTTGWIEGIVVQNGGWLGLLKEFAAAPNTTVTAQNGDVTRSATANPDGTFRLTDLKPGRQTVSFASPGLPPGKLLSEREQPTEVPKGGCAYVNATFETDSSLAGRVVTSTGLPAANVRLDLGEVQSDGKVKRIPNTWANTAKDGSFLINNLPMGKIVLGANINGAPSKDERYDTVYAPGVQTLAKARIFTVKPTEKVTGVTLRLPPPLPFGYLYVDVQWSDGSPATGGARAKARWRESRAAFEDAPKSGNRVALPVALNRHYEISADWLSDAPGHFTFLTSKNPVPVDFAKDGQIVTIRLDAMPPKKLN